MPRERNTSPLFILVAIIAVVAALVVAKAILLPLALAILLTFLFTPLANRIERLGVPRVPTAILVVAMAFALLIGLGWIVTDQVIGLSTNLEEYKRNVIAKIQAMKPTKESTVGKVSRAVEDVRQEIEGDSGQRENARDAGQEAGDSSEPVQNGGLSSRLPLLRGEPPEQPSGQEVKVKVEAMPQSPLAQVQAWLGPLVAPVTTAGLVIVLVFFILLDRENQRDRLIQLFGAANLHTTTEALEDAGKRVGRYLRMMFLMNAGYGVAVVIGLSLIGVPSAIMWGVLGFALRFLPYLGPWLAAALPMLIAVAVSEGWTQPMLVAGMYIVFELFLNNVAEPLLYGSSIGVSTVGVFVAAIFWTWIWGPIGLIVAMPMTVCIVVLARYVPELRFVTVLLADQPPLTPAQRVYQRLLACDFNEPLKRARDYLKTHSLVEYYDEVLIPAIVLAERDRTADQLSARQEAFVEEAAEDLVEELADLPTANDEEKDDAAAGEAAPSERTTAHVLCVPLLDEADEIASRMLAQLLERDGFHVESGAAASLTSEIVDRVASAEAQIVVISVMPPIRARDSRLLWKRLRQRYPNLPIIVGFWTGAGEPAPLPAPQHDAASKMVTTLAEAIAAVRATAAQLRLAKAI